MKSFGQWLTEIGLQSYAAIFSENKIDFDVVRSLSETDLRELGLALGDRKRLLQAIAKLDAQDVVELGPSGSTLPTIQSLGAASTPEPLAGERRQLTVMFCDLVGSTALSERLDPEELRTVLHNYRSVCGEVIARYEGFVARYVGDGILVYFGWPVAHEDDAERSIRAALDVVAAIKQIAAKDILSVRVGVSTGPVVVGDQAGVGDQAKLAIGTTPNLAARMQGLAAADQVVIAESTRRLIGNAFELVDLGELELKGISEPVRAYRVQDIAATAGRFEAARSARRLTPLVGREEEIALLLRRWQLAKETEGHAVLLAGEPGIGKSRIVQELRERLSAETCRVLTFQCSPYHTHSAFFPIITHFEQLAGFARDDTPEQKLDKLEAITRSIGGVSEAAVPLFASLLSLPTDRYPPLQFSPQRQKEELMRGIVGQLSALANHQPVLGLFEDVHWIDPSSLEMLDLAVQALQHTRILLAITYRPEFQPRWVGQSHVTLLTLNRLARRHSANMIVQVTEGKSLPVAVLEHIVEKTDGVPLFVEELTKSVLEGGLLTRAGEGYELNRALDDIAIPSSLQDSLMARLDRLGVAKEIAQIGACIGREFSYEVLAAVYEGAEDRLHRALEQLENSDLVLRNGTPPFASYTFKHALIHDAAYESLLKTRRQNLHARIAEVLEQRFPALMATQPEVLAQHLSAANKTELAMSAWLRASDHATTQIGYEEAVSHARAGLRLTTQLPQSAQRDHAELLLWSALGYALSPLKGPGHLETGEAYSRARQLCAVIGQNDSLKRVVEGLTAHYLLRADYETSAMFARELLAIANRTQDPDAQLASHAMLAIGSYFCGQRARSVTHCNSGLRVYDPLRRSALLAEYGWDPGQGCEDVQAGSYLLEGYIDRHRKERGRLAQLGRSDPVPLVSLILLIHASLWAAFERDIETARSLADEAIGVCDSTGILWRRFECEVVRGWTRVQLGELDDGIEEIKRGADGWQQMGAEIGRPTWLGFLAEGYLKAQRWAEASACLTEVLELIGNTGERLYEPELLRLKGVLFLDGPEHDVAQAEQYFVSAISVAHTQGSRLFELRATNSLAQLWKDRGKRVEARDLLAPLYSWFTEGLDARDLQDAKALLDSLPGRVS